MLLLCVEDSSALKWCYRISRPTVDKNFTNFTMEKHPCAIAKVDSNAQIVERCLLPYSAFKFVICVSTISTEDIAKCVRSRYQYSA